MSVDSKKTFRRFDVDVLDFLHSESVEVMDSSEVGQYFLLLLHSWANEKGATLPDDPAYLARLARVQEVSARVLDKFEIVDLGDGPRRRNAALYEEWLRTQKRSHDGLRDANKRWHPGGSDMGSQKAPNAQIRSDQDNKDTSNEFDLSPVWDYYIEQIDRNPKLYTLTPERRAMGKKRLMEAIKKTGGYEKAIQLMKLAIDALRDSAFHNGKNDSKIKYNSWEILFRSAGKFEEWLERESQ